MEKLEVEAREKEQIRKLDIVKNSMESGEVHFGPFGGMSNSMMINHVKNCCSLAHYRIDI